MITTCIVAAGIAQLGIAAGNLLLPRLLDYRRHLPGLDPFLRQIYVVHSLYIILVVALLGALCVAFPAELAGASALARALCAGLALFWGLRLVLQVAWFRAAVPIALRPLAAAFTLTVASLAALFTALAAGVRP